MSTREMIYCLLKVLNVQVILSSLPIQQFEGSSLLLAKRLIVVAGIQAPQH